MGSTRYPFHPGNMDYNVWGFVIEPADEVLDSGMDIDNFN